MDHRPQTLSSPARDADDILRGSACASSTFGRRAALTARPLVGTIGAVSGPPSELVFHELSTFVYSDAPACSDCSRVDDPAGIVFPPGSPAPTFDISKTLDGAILASEAFRAVCADVPGLRYVGIAGLDGHWMIEVECFVGIEPFRSNVRAGAICSTCGRPRYVTRSGPIQLDSAAVLPEGFCGTDVEFGDSGDFGPSQPIRFRPHVLVDRATAQLLKSADLLGIHLITQP